MSASLRLVLSPKCRSPLSPINQHLGKSLLVSQKQSTRKLDFFPSPSKSCYNDNNNNRQLSQIRLTVPSTLLVNTPQKNHILKNGLSEKNGLNILGRGTFGTVVRGVFQNQDVAVKVIKYDAKRNKKLRESNILGLTHANIIKTIDVVTSPSQNHAMVIMEYLGNSRQLQSILDDRSFELKAESVAKFALDVCRGLSFCHQNAILHLDIKPSNILVCEDGRCKLCDFGSCFKANAQEKAEPYIHQGTVAYTAPEILLGKEPTVKADVYSFGILLWQMVHRRIPYDSIDRSEIIIYKVVKFGLRPTGLTADGFGALYRQCWLTLPEDRPDLQTVINSLCLV